MTPFSRYAIYVRPPPGALARKAASWLGWDPVAAAPCPPPELPGLPRPLEELTEAPRKYGFHGTLRAPFRPADGLAEDDLRAAVARLAASLGPVRLEGLRLAALGRFLALCPLGDGAALAALAAAVVERSNGWRAPLSPAEYARRGPERLTDRQRALLEAWGYPYVFEEFRFHMTLTGPLQDGEHEAVMRGLDAYLRPDIPAPFEIDSLCLFGERPDGRFQLLDRYPLAGRAAAPVPGLTR